MSRRATRDRGLTLLELIAATAIFALVSVMALQALSGGIVQRRVIQAGDADRSALLRTLALLRQDLEASLVLPAHGDEVPAPQRAESTAAGAFTLLRAGLPVLPGQPGDGFARVVWRVDAGTGRLLRQSAARGGAEAPAMTMLEGVLALRLVTYGEAGKDQPRGYQAVIETGRHGALRVVVAR